MMHVFQLVDVGKSLIFVALGESIALYGLVISIMILSKLV